MMLKNVQVVDYIKDSAKIKKYSRETHRACLYAIDYGGKTKIGRTYNINQRLYEHFRLFKKSNPTPNKWMVCVSVEMEHANQKEAQIIKKLAEHRIDKTEMFSLEFDIVVKIIEEFLESADMDIDNSPIEWRREKLQLALGNNEISSQTADINKITRSDKTMDNKNFPFNIFNQDLIDSSAEHYKETKAKYVKANDVAEKIMVYLDGLTLEEVDHVAMVLRLKCQANAVVHLEK